MYTLVLKHSIPATILNQLLHIYLPFLTNSVNHFLHENKFPDELQQSEVITLYKTNYIR